MKSHLKNILFLALSTIIVYLGTLNNGFVQEDYIQIVNNKAFQNPSFLFDVLSGWRDDSAKLAGHFRPIYSLSYYLDYLLWGVSPLGYHLTNLILHLIVTILVYCFGYLLFNKAFLSFVAALTFAIHPIHTEAVDYITSRADMVCTLFYLLSLIFFLKYRLQSSKWALLFLSLLFFMLSLLSKEMGATLPLILLLLDMSTGQLKKDKLPRSFLPYLYYFVILLVYILLRSAILGGVFSENQEAPSFIDRMMTMPGVIIHYIKLLFLPFPNKVYYPTIIIENWFNIYVLGPMLCIILILVGIYLFYKRNSIIFLASMWFFITLIPVANIVPIAGFFMAERFLYLPSIGFALFSASVVQSRRFFTTLCLLSAIFYLALSTLTVYRHSVWRDQTTYWNAFQADIEGSFVGHTEFGKTYLNGGLLDQAIAEFEKALRINPDYKQALLKLGYAYEQKGLLGKAENLYRKVISLYPANFDARFSLGIVYGKMGHYEDAVQELLIAVKLNPKDGRARYNLGMAYESLGRFKEAMIQYSIASELMSDWRLPREGIERVSRE